MRDPLSLETELAILTIVGWDDCWQANLDHVTGVERIEFRVSESVREADYSWTTKGRDGIAAV